MTTASRTSAKALYSEPKQKLCDKVNLSINSFGQLASQTGKSSSEILQKTNHNFAQLEGAIEESHDGLSKIATLGNKLEDQLLDLEKAVQGLEALKEQAQSMRR